MAAASASDLITPVVKFVPSGIIYGVPKLNDHGGKSIRILDSNRNPLVLGTPLMLTWGINKMIDEKSGKVSYNLSLQFPNAEYGTPETTAFLHKMQEMQDKVLNDAIVYGKDWLGKKVPSRDVAEAIFTPMVRYPKNQQTGDVDMSRAPTFRVGIPYYEGKFNMELYDMERRPIFAPHMNVENIEEFIPKGSHVACVLSCGGVWVAAGKFGVTWKLTQAIVRKPFRFTGGCYVPISDSDRIMAEAASKREVLEFAESSALPTHEEEDVSTAVVDDEDEETVAVVAPVAAAAAASSLSAPKTSSAHVDDSDGDEDDAKAVPAVAAQPVAVAAAKPRKVVKKTVKA